MLSAVPNSIFDLSAVASKGAAQGSNASPSKRREPLTATPYRSLARRWPSGSTTAGRRCQSWTQITGLRTITEGLRTGRATSTGKPGSGKPSARGIGWVVEPRTRLHIPAPRKYHQQPASYRRISKSTRFSQCTIKSLEQVTKGWQPGVVSLRRQAHLSGCSPPPPLPDQTPAASSLSLTS